MDFSKERQRSYHRLKINGALLVQVDHFQYLGVHITQDLSRSRHVNTLVKKARQHLHHHRWLKDFKLPLKDFKKDKIGRAHV